MTTETHFRSKTRIRAIVSGFLATWILSELLKFSTSFEALVFYPVVQGAVIFVTLFPLGMLLIWGEHEGREQKAFARAISVVGIIAICIQGVASLLGWLGGTATHAPITMQALIYGSSIAGFTGILLWYYRFLRKQGHKATLVGYGLAALLVIVATILGDEFALSTGILIFAHGYTILTDLIYAIFLLCVPIILFEAFVKLQRYTA